MSDPTQAVPVPPRVPTGVAGLDAILGGGLFKGGVYIVMGKPGVGKTILGNQIAFRHVAAGGRAVYATLLSETHGRLLAFLQTMAFFDASAVGDAIAYVNGYVATEADGLAGLLQIVRGTVRDRRASLLVIDGMVTAASVASSEEAYKRFIQELQTWVEMIGCTVLLLTSSPADGDVRPEQTMVDGVFQLDVRAAGPRRIRQLAVTKFRGSAYLEGEHVYEIDAGGIHVYPRLEPALAGAEPIDFDPEYVGFGIPPLDVLIGGGFMRGSTTMILGPAGSGKSTLAQHFLRAGLAAGETVACFGFFANTPLLVRVADEMGFGFSEAVKMGRFHAWWQPAAERLLDKMGWQILDLVAQVHPARLVVDGIEGFRQTEDPERLSGFFAVLSQELRRQRVTSIFTAETSAPIGPDLVVPSHRLSAITQNIVLLRAVGRERGLERTLAVLKTRDRAHDSAVTPFSITSRGIVLTGDRAPRGI
jgi:circadian clock protein KaiC